jgi:hypothetical protein
MSTLCQKQTFWPLLDIIVGGQGCSNSWSITLKLPRRKFLHLAAGAAALPITARIALALDYPARPARIIVGFAPAGGTDIIDAW